jgi:tRNA 2-thiouridine synthesizing protein C
MTNLNRKKILIICRKPPYGNSLSKEAIDIALACAAFEQDMALLFLDDGIYQLLKDQQTDTIKSKNHGKILSALPLYDIDQIYVEFEAMEKRKMTSEDLIIPVTELSNDDIIALMQSSDVVFSF